MNISLFNKNKKTEEHLIEIKFILLFIFFVLGLNFILLLILINVKNNYNKKYSNSNSKYKQYNCKEEDIINKIVYLYNGKHKPCLEIKYDIKEESIKLNDFQKDKLNEIDLKLLTDNNAKVILYKDKTNNILGVSCPRFSIHNDRMTIFMNDFTGNNLNKLFIDKNKKDSLLCPPMIKKK